MKNFCIGIDYGTDSVRSLLVDADTGEQTASSTFKYPRWKKGLYCDPGKNQFRQHPLDYLEGLEYVVKTVVSEVPGAGEHLKAISVDTTGSTPAAVNEQGTPLSLLPEFRENPNAMFVLWKDHTAIAEADEINKHCKNWGGEDYSKYSGGIYSSEWFWSKIIHVIRTDQSVARAACSWVEHCDWIPALLTGVMRPVEIKRSRCAAGHKAMWRKSWNGLPSEDFLTGLEPQLARLRSRLYAKTYTSDVPAGTITQEWARKLGINDNVQIGVGGLDAHFGAVGGGIKNRCLSKVIGTSTCDMVVADYDELGEKCIEGISGQVDGSIIPGKIGMEAGQSAFGDIFAWFKDLLLWPLKNMQHPGLERTEARLLDALSRQAENAKPGRMDLIALDWFNGRRSPYANAALKGGLYGINLGTDAPQIFRALVEATAFGSRKINDRFREKGIAFDEVYAMGGVAKKSPFVMQVLANVFNMPVKLVKSEQTCALGAAMFASVVAGVYRKTEEAQEKMGSGIDLEYRPDKKLTGIYEDLYKKYTLFGKFVETKL